LKKIAALAEAHYIGMAPHNPNGPLATAMNLQFAATIPNYLILETIGSQAEQKLAEALVNHPPVLAEGQLNVPAGPGWGVELTEAALARCPYAPDGGRR